MENPTAVALLSGRAALAVGSFFSRGRRSAEQMDPVKLAVVPGIWRRVSDHVITAVRGPGPRRSAHRRTTSGPPPPPPPTGPVGSQLEDASEAQMTRIWRSRAMQLYGQVRPGRKMRQKSMSDRVVLRISISFSIEIND